MSPRRSPLSHPLDDVSHLRAADPGGMLGFLARLPEVAGAAFTRGASVPLPTRTPRSVVIAGMGGSAISGDLARNLLHDRAGFPISVNRHAKLPAHVGPEDLVILLSYSGSTAETLGCLQEALSRGLPLVLVTSGGAFAALAAEHHLPVVRLEPGWMPRAALGELYFSLLGLLSQLVEGPLDVTKAIARLRAERARYLPELPTEQNPAKQLALTLLGKTPVVFGVTPTTEAVAMRWKAQLNENSKVTVLMGVFPELTHNEIVNLGAARHPDHHAVILRDEADPPLLRRQSDLACEVIAPMLGGMTFVTPTGDDLLARQLSSVYLGDYVSVYLAIARGMDPTPVDAIFQLKDRMARTEEHA